MCKPLSSKDIGKEIAPTHVIPCGPLVNVGVDVLKENSFSKNPCDTLGNRNKAEQTNSLKPNKENRDQTRRNQWSRSDSGHGIQRCGRFGCEGVKKKNYSMNIMTLNICGCGS